MTTTSQSVFAPANSINPTPPLLASIVVFLCLVLNLSKKKNQKPPSKSPSPLDDNKWTRSFRDILVIDLPKSSKQWSVTPHLISKPKPAPLPLPPPKLEAPPPPPSQTRGFSLRPNRQPQRPRFKLPVVKKESPLEQPRPTELFENPEPESESESKSDDYNSDDYNSVYS
ncbi:hypothetical protein ACFE04_007648 [Oxalis oulophora]